MVVSWWVCPVIFYKTYFHASYWVSDILASDQVQITLFALLSLHAKFMSSSFVLFFRRYMLVSTPFWYINRLLKYFIIQSWVRLNQQTLEWWFMNGLGVHLCWLEKVLKNCKNVTHPASIFWRKPRCGALLMFDLHYIVVFHTPLRFATDCAIITSMWVWNKRKVSAIRNQLL